MSNPSDDESSSLWMPRGLAATATAAAATAATATAATETEATTVDDTPQRRRRRRRRGQQRHSLSLDDDDATDLWSETDTQSANSSSSSSSNSNSSSSNDDDDDFARPNQHRQRQRDAALYGVGGDSDTSEGDQRQRRHGTERQRRRHERPPERTTARAAPPRFVSGATVSSLEPTNELPLPVPPASSTVGTAEAVPHTGSTAPPTTTTPTSISATATAAAAAAAVLPEATATAASDDDDDTRDERRLHRQRNKADEANQTFLDLLHKGGRTNHHRTRTPSSVAHNHNRTTTTTTTQIPLVTTTGTTDPALPWTTRHVPDQFGRSTTTTSQQRLPKKDPSVGTWEKHTKGIGMKLLTKMGYSGSGGLVGGKRKRNLQQQQQQSRDGATVSGSTRPDDDDAVVVPVTVATTTGIAAPVQVKVRPTNLGLGYGAFQEATSLASNRTIEAQVRGGGLDQHHHSITTLHTKHPTSSLLDRTKRHSKLLQPWKRQRTTHPNATHHKTKRSTTTPEWHDDVLLQEQAIQIIDMRGPAAATALFHMPTAPPTSPLVGEELLHNVALLRHTYETRMQSAEDWTRSHQRQRIVLEDEVAELKQQQNEAKERQAKLERTLIILDDLATAIDTTTNATTTLVDTLDETMAVVYGLVQQLIATFTALERKQLDLNHTLVPNILGAFVQTALETIWNPRLLFSEKSAANGLIPLSSSSTMALLRSVLLLHQKVGNENENKKDWFEIRKSVLLQFVAPAIRRVLESPRWDPITDHANVGLLLYESLLSIVNSEVAVSHQSSDIALDDETTPARNGMFGTINQLDAEGDNGSRALSISLRKMLIHSTVYSKLTRALTQSWKPQVDNTGALVDRPDLWILPWLPHLSDDRAAMPALVADCKRTIRSAVAFLAQNVVDDHQFLQACAVTMRPWRGIFKTETIQGTCSTSVTPRIARYLSRYIVLEGADARDQPLWSVLDLIYQMNSSGLLSDLDIVSVIEGELMPNWASSMHARLRSMRTEKRDPVMWAIEVAESYCLWKSHIIGVALPEKNGDTRLIGTTYALMRNDVNVCASFYAVLLMIQACFDKECNDSADALMKNLFISPDAVNYRLVLQRRKVEIKRQAADDLIRMEASGLATSSIGAHGNGKTNGDIEARVRLHHTTAAPSFRDVVAEYAREHDIHFQPRMGPSSAINGKQVYLFGNVPIYLDGNVAFVSQGSGVWKPMALDELATLAVREPGVVA